MTRFTTIATVAAVAALVTTAGTPDAAARIAAPIGIASAGSGAGPAHCPGRTDVTPECGLCSAPFDGRDCLLINRPLRCKDGDAY